MPLTADSPLYLHTLQNLSLIAICVFFTPLCTFIALLSQLISPFTATHKAIQRQREWTLPSPPPPSSISSTSTSSNGIISPPLQSRRTILVTGVGMSKGLALARAFYQAGHVVIGADFEPWSLPVSGRFSRALTRFYRLPSPSVGGASESESESKDPNGGTYVTSLLDIITREHVDLWISCSGVASALEDASAVEAIERLTPCRAVQFGVALTTTLHEKHSFIEKTRELGLNVPETHLVTDVETAMQLLYGAGAVPGRRFIMKSVGLDDSIRANMTLLPLSSGGEGATRAHLSKMRPSVARPFVLQQFIRGPEYCTHAVVIKGEVLVFTACESAEILMHYKALPTGSKLFQAMFAYTKKYARGVGREMTGHFSMDFLLDEVFVGGLVEDESAVGGEAGVNGNGNGNENVHGTANGDGNPDEQAVGLMERIFPIECNPRAHTAVVLMAGREQEMVNAYLQLLQPEKPTTAPSPSPVIFSTTTKGYYWIGHDLITRALLPTLLFPRSFIQSSSSPSSSPSPNSNKYDLSALLAKYQEFVVHVLSWRDGTFALCDPWPWCWMYVVYWPGVFGMSLWEGVRGGEGGWWSRCNVSTNKCFRC